MSAPSAPGRLALPDAPRAVARSFRDYLALGHQVHAGSGCRVVRCDEAPVIYDANHLQVTSAASPEEIAAALEWMEARLGDRPHRQVRTDPETPPAVCAELALRGYRPTPLLQLLLQGPLRGPAPDAPVEIRPVSTPDDWDRLHRLFRLDHLEEDERKGKRDYAEEVTAQMVATKRLKAPAVQFFLAWEGDEAVAFFSAWPGSGGVGMVEDLFTLPERRGRGIARALIHHCVADARARGAGPVLIGADPEDTPMHAYAGMGFRPTCLTWSWMRRPAGPDTA